ncbi:MAG: hypothetical protein GDA51_08690 [Ekhidna sp.]|nr:hypothetical protein [Ekhidna sp.]
MKTLERQQVDLQPKRSFYDKLEVDEFRTYVGKKSHKKWFIFSPKHVCVHQRNLRESREPVAWVLGKRNEKTVSALWFKIKAPSITFFMLPLHKLQQMPVRQLYKVQAALQRGCIYLCVCGTFHH